MVSVILLAAGASRRMGRENKLLLPFGNQIILEATLSQLELAGADEILVVTGHEQGRIRAVLDNHSCQIVYNPEYEKGMTTSIQAGIRHAGTGTAGYMICLADMPLVCAAEYRLLIETFTGMLLKNPGAIVQPQYQGQRGNPVLFSSVYRDALLALEYPEGGKPIVQANKKHLHLVDMPSDAVLLDADTPETYRLLLERLETDSV